MKQLPSLTNPIPAARAAAATYSWPLRMTCAPNGGCPDILIVMCPHCGSMMWKEEWLTKARFLARLTSTPSAERVTSQTGATARATRIRNTPRSTSWVARYSSAISCLRSPRLQSITGMPCAAAEARTRRANRPAIRIRCALSNCSSSPCRRRHQVRNPPGHPHQMRIAHLLVVAVQASPPGPEPAGVVTQRVVGVEHDPVHAVVAAVEQIAVPLTEPVVRHLGRLPSAAPPGATDSEQRL